MPTAVFAGASPCYGDCRVGAYRSYSGLVVDREIGEIAVMQKHLLVGTGSQALRIGFLTPAGKPRMDSASWLNGARLTDGERFG